MDLFRKYFDTHFAKLSENGVKINVYGDISAFPEDLRLKIDAITSTEPEKLTGTLNVAMNYGARSEIVRAVNAAVKTGKAVDEQSFARLLYSADVPDPDLIVRTSGEQRLSNFMLYQAAYSELYFCKKMWPDFGKRDLYKALKSYASRNRRYGK